jgi:hypothetical protein
LRETREFAEMLTNWRRAQPTVPLATVTWFEVSGPPPCVVTFQIALREAALWLTGADPVGRSQMFPKMELRICPVDVNLEEVLRRVGTTPIEPGCALHATIIVRPQLPYVVILVVPNFTADAATLTLLVDRLTDNYGRMIRTAAPDWTTPPPFTEPRYADFVGMPALAERIAAISAALSGAIWIEHRHLTDAGERPSALANAHDRYGQLVLPLSSDEGSRLAAARGRNRATFTMLALCAWSSVLGMVTAAGNVAVLMNTTARQFDGLETLPGFFYDLGVVVMPTRIDGASAITAARRAVLDHHANYVPSSILCDLVPAYRAVMAESDRLLVAVQAKAADIDASIQFGHGYRTPARTQMSHDVAFSIPIDALMTLETDPRGARIVFEYRQCAIGHAAAADLAVRFKRSLVSLTR